MGWLTLGGLVALGLTAGVADAHPRNYANFEVFILTCIDDQFTVLGTGGAAGGVLNTVGAAVDPFAPDSGGSCYRANHILPNVNGDVTISVVDQVQTNVGLCVSQDSDGDGGFCNDEGDFQIRGCNAVTVNTNFPVPNAWRFLDAQGVPARRTLVAVSFFSEASALIGPNPDCGEGVDAFGTTGNINHS